MKAIIGGSTTCTRNIIHWVAKPTLCPKALVVQMSTEDAKGSIEVSSEKVRPTGISRMAKIGKMTAAPAPVTENQYGASASHPPITAPEASAIMDTKLRFLFNFCSPILLSLSNDFYRIASSSSSVLMTWQ